MTTNTTAAFTVRNISRRTALRAAAVAVPAAAAAFAIPGFAGADVANGTTTTTTANGATIELIDAISATSDTRPTGPDYIRYEDLYVAGDSLQTVLNKVTGNRILTLPEGEFTFRDFTAGYYDGIRIGSGGATGCRGIVGSGRNTVIRGVANTATRDKGGKTAGTQLTIGKKAGAVLSNFSVKGNPQNGLYYGGITVDSCPDATITKLYLRGASRGYANYPPGETFGINILNSDRVTIADCEVDGRDDAGTRVASSPIGWNGGRDAKLYRTYCHHGLTGMLTFWQTVNVYTEDYKCFSTSSGTGILSGSGINHEQASGVIKHVRPQLIINGSYSTAADKTASNGLHMGIANSLTDIPSFTVVEPIWDKNAGTTGMMTFSIRDGYTVAGQGQKVVTPPTVIKNGVTLKRSDHPVKGWGDKDPNQYFAWVH